METNFYPLTQRRLRADAHIRELTASVKLSHKSFIQPLFADEAITEPRDVIGLNGIQAGTVDSTLQNIEQHLQNGITKFLLFPVPAQKKDKDFDFSFASNTVKKIKATFGEAIWIAADICLCSYTSHGHCGILNKDHSQ